MTLPGENVSARFVVPTVAASIDLLVHAALERDGRRTVREVAAVPGRVEGDVEIADLFLRRGGELVRADGFLRLCSPPSRGGPRQPPPRRRHQAGQPCDGYVAGVLNDDTEPGVWPDLPAELEPVALRLGDC